MNLTKINSANLVKYNANTRGKSVGDCVKRSMSLAFDMSYNDIGKLLNEKMKALRAYQWNIQRVFNPVIKDLGGSDPIRMEDSNCTVEEFADSIAQPGKAYLILCGKKYGDVSHMVCIRDKDIFDSWDCSDYLVTKYYTTPERALKPTTDIQSTLADICKEYATPILQSEIKRYFTKKDWEGNYEFESKRRDYRVTYTFTVIIYADGLILKNREYSFDIAFVFTPTMSEDEAIEYIQKTAKTRMYDRMYAIDGQEKKLKEAEEMKLAAGLQNEKTYEEKYYISKAEERFLNSLPGWIRPLIKTLRIDRPGSYSDSYTLVIRPLPDDPNRSSDERIRFEGLDADELKAQIYRYKDTYDVPWDDYNPNDMY